MTRVRWWILGLLFIATTINYLDRIVFSVLIPVIRGDLKIDDKQYGYLTGAFTLAYTIGFLLMSKFIDRYGTRIGYAVSIAWWSVAACCHAFAGTALSLAFWRAMLGLGEAGNFPAAIKCVAEWFPKKDRAFATGLFNSGPNIASMIGPPLFVWITANHGWRASFVVTGALGFVWLAIWMVVYRLPSEHRAVNKAELEYINADVEASENTATMSWGAALKMRQTWGFTIAKFISDPVWWFYIYWLPPYLYDVRKFSMQELGWSLPVVYSMSSVGSVAGGWLSGFLIRRGWSTDKARKTSLAACAAVMPIAALAVIAPGPVLTIALVSLATAGHQGWSANLYTTNSDVFPKRAVASVTGIGGCAGGFGGVLFSALVPGFVVSKFGYTPMFLSMGVFHLIALFAVYKLMGKKARVATD